MSGRKQVRAVVLAALLVLSTFSMVGVGAASAAAGNTSETTFHVSQGGNCYNVSALGNGDQTVKEFYDYRSNETTPKSYTYASFGTTHLQDNQESKLFVYNGANGYSLVMVHDKMATDGGDGSYGSTVTFNLSGMPDDGSWAVKDDTYGNDTQDDNWDTSGSTHKIDWMWASNRTDGGAFRGIAGNEITIDPGFNQQANEWDNWAYAGDANNETQAWKLIDGDESEQKLDMSKSLTVAQGDCSNDTEPSTGPTADFSVSDSTVANDETVTFDASNSSDDTGIAEYRWDFDGDGAIDETTDESSTTHSYDKPGEYEATLTVTDDDGNTDTASANVTVEEADDGSPTVNSFDLWSPDNKTVEVSLYGSSSITDIEANVTNENGTTVATLTEEDFTVRDAGTYDEYRATTTVEANGTYTSTLLKAADADGNDAANGQTARTHVGPVDGSIEYTNASAVEVTGEFERVWIHEYWYNEAGLASETFVLENTTGTTNFSTYHEGMNGSIVTGVAAHKVAGGSADISKDNPYDYEIRPEPVNVSVQNVTETGDGVYEVTFAYENPNDENMLAHESQFVTGNADAEPPWRFYPGENTTTVTWTPDSDDERLTWEVNLSNFDLEDVSASTQSASAYGGAGDGDDGSPNAHIEAPDWAHQNSGADFDGRNSTDDGKIVSYEWEFSDGGNATGEEVNYIYNSTGNHTATLTVTDDDGNTDSQTVSIEIRKEDVTAPNASVTASPKTAETGETVTFDGSNSSDESGISKYRWDFDGDNEYDRTTDEPTTTYTFSEPGEYEVSLAVDDDGDHHLTDTDTVNVTVEESSSEPPSDGEPTAKLSLTKQTADFDQKVGFNASAATDDGSIAEYRWDFDGDGEVDRTTPDNATGKNNPAHTVWHEVAKIYDEPGTYSATVTVVDDDGNADTANTEITIKKDATPPSATLHVPPEATVDEEITVEATNFTESNLKHICWKIDGHDKPDGATATHTFEETGEHEVTLRIVDQAGNANLLDTTINVTAADDGSDGPNEDPNDPPEGGLNDGPNNGNTGGSLPSASPPEDGSNDDSNDDQAPKKAALNDTEGTYGEITLQTDATDATVEVTETVPGEMRQPTAERDGFKALSFVTVSGAENFEATFTISKDRLESADASPEDVTLFEFDDGSWNAVETEQLNETDGAFKFSANASNGTYAVGIDAPSTAVEDLRVADDRVAPGDEVTVTVSVTNDGRASGTQDVVLTVDGETVATKSVSVEANSTATVEFTHSFEAPGVHTVNAGDANAEIVVEGIETTDTDDGSETATTTATETGDNSSSNVPGFGVGAALVALAAAALLARRQA